MYESLHNHTLASDGLLTHAEMLTAAKRLGYGTIAFTDHDALPDEATMASLRTYDGPVKWLIGCEISSDLPLEMAGVNGVSHILGLFTNPANVALREHCRIAVAARHERVTMMVQNLHGLGFKITEDDVFTLSGGENVGRKHIERALHGYRENDAVIESIRLQFEEAAKESPAMAMDYMYMMSRHKSDWPYRLFLSRDAFIPNIFVDYLYKIDLDESVKLIREAGGIAIYGHWWTDRKFMSLEKLEELLKDGRLDGLEIRAGLVDEVVIKYGNQAREVVERLGQAWTIGVDSHRESDLMHYSRNYEVMELAKGQTARLITQFKPDLETCSSL